MTVGWTVELLNNPIFCCGYLGWIRPHNIVSTRSRFLMPVGSLISWSNWGLAELEQHASERILRNQHLLYSIVYNYYIMQSTIANILSTHVGMYGISFEHLVPRRLDVFHRSRNPNLPGRYCLTAGKLRNYLLTVKDCQVQRSFRISSSIQSAFNSSSRRLMAAEKNRSLPRPFSTNFHSSVSRDDWQWFMCLYSSRLHCQFLQWAVHCNHLQGAVTISGHKLGALKKDLV